MGFQPFIGCPPVYSIPTLLLISPILYRPFYWLIPLYICPAINTTSPITQRPIRSLVGEELRVIKLLMGNKKIADSQEIETFRDNIFPNLDFVEEAWTLCWTIIFWCHNQEVGFKRQVWSIVPDNHCIGSAASSAGLLKATCFTKAVAQCTAVDDLKRIEGDNR